MSVVEQRVVSLATVAQDAADVCRIVAGDGRGVRHVFSVNASALGWALGSVAPWLSRDLRRQIGVEIDRPGVSIAALNLDGGEPLLYVIGTRDGGGVPPDPARWVWDHFALMFFGGEEP